MERGNEFCNPFGKLRVILSLSKDNCSSATQLLADKIVMPVKKGELVQRLADRFGVSKKQSAEWLDAFTDEITKVLRSGDKVNITGFGIFKVADRKAREGINPKTGEKIHIAASKKPRFTAGKLLKEAVK